MKKATLTIACLALLLYVAAISAGTKSAKARFFYLAAVEQEAAGNNAEAYDLYRRAWQIDPQYEEAAYSIGEARLMMDMDTFQTWDGLLASMGLMQRYIDNNPLDYASAMYYAYVASELGESDEAKGVYERLDSLFPGKEDLLMNLARIYARTDSVKKGIAVLDRLEQINGVSPNLSLTKMSYYMAADDTVGALREGNALIGARPRDPIGWLVKASLFEMIGQNDSCLSSLLTAETLDPERGATKLSLAKFYAQNGDSVNYDQKIYEALQSDDIDPGEKVDILANYLQTLFTDSADTSRGDALFAILNSQMPFEPALISLSSRYNAAKGDFESAMDDAKRALALMPADMDTWTRLFSYYAVQEKYDMILPEYEKLKTTVKPDVVVIIMVGSALQMAKQYDDAVKVYSDIILLNHPSYSITVPLSQDDLLNLENLSQLERYEISNAYNLIGDVFQLKGDLDSTYATYDNALLAIPFNASVLNNYAYFLTINGGDLDKAYAMASEAIKQEGENPTYLDTYAWVLFKRKEFLQAKVYQSKAVELAEKGEAVSFDLYDHYGDILFFLDGNADEALKYWEKALEMDPGNELIKKKIENKTYFNE